MAIRSPAGLPGAIALAAGLALAVIAVVLALGRGGGDRAGSGARGLAAEPAGDLGQAPLAPSASEDPGQTPAEVVSPAGGRAALGAQSGWAIGGGEGSQAQRCTVRGRVVDPRGRGVEGAEIAAASGAGPPAAEVPASSPSRLPGRVLAGAAGAFELPGVQPGALRLSVRAAGFAPLDRAGLSVPAGGELDLGALALLDGAILPGRVIDAGGAPVAGAELFSEPEGEVLDAMFRPTLRLAETDAGGAFRIDVLAPGPWRLRVRHSEHPDGLFEGECAAAGLSPEVELHLGAGAWIHGRALGTPLALEGELRVLAVPEELSAARFDRGGDGARAEPRAAPLASDGAFAIGGLRPGDRYRLSLVAGRDPRSKAVSATAGARDVELVFAAGASVSLRAVDARTGAPIEELAVRHGTWALEHGDGEPAHRAGGRVLLTELVPVPVVGAYVLELAAEGHAARRVELEGLAVGELRDLGDLLLESRPVIAVRVRELHGGRPVAGARVHVVAGEDDRLASWGAGGRARRSASTDSGGRARVTRPAGSGEALVVVASGFAPHVQPVLEGAAGEQAELELSLAPGAGVLVRASDDLGVPIAGLRIAHRRPADVEELAGGVLPRLAAVTDEAGTARFSHLEAGEHMFRAEPPAGGEAAFESLEPPSAEASFEVIAVPASGTVELELVVPARAAIRGVVRAGGLALSGARVELVAPESDLDPLRATGPSATTDEAGAFRLDEVPLGEQVVLVTHPARAMDHREPLHVPRGGADVSIELSSASIAGHAISGGAPAAGVRVRVRRAAGGDAPAPVLVRLDPAGGVHVLGGAGAASAVTDADGRYRLDGVVTGVALALTFEADHVVPRRLETPGLAPGEAREGIDLVLSRAGAVQAEALREGGGSPGLCLVVAEPVNAPGGARTSALLSAGSALLGGLAPGTWEVTLRPAGGPGADFEAQVQVVSISAGETSPARFSVPAAGP